MALLALSLANSSCLHLLLHSEVIGPRFPLPCCISGIWPAILPLPGGLTGPDNSLPSSMGKLLTGAAKVMLGCVSPLLQDILLSLGWTCITTCSLGNIQLGIAAGQRHVTLAAEMLSPAVACFAACHCRCVHTLSAKLTRGQ